LVFEKEETVKIACSVELKEKWLRFNETFRFEYAKNPYNLVD